MCHERPTPAANAASRKKEITPGSQRGRRENERFAISSDWKAAVLPYVGRSGMI
jgi:hypothetical protein